MRDEPRPATQGEAYDPDSFVWVTANAGAGKTHVLVERLVRILLSGTPPSRILCLTFTNAAAAEMANRLFRRLSDWAVIGDETKLAAEIGALTGAAPDHDMLARARRLFAIALESPGGLKIHTIHAFCERLLHRFALEAGVSPHFAVLDERGRSDLLVEARETVMNRAAALDPSVPLAAALATVSALAHDITLDQLLSGLVDDRETIAALELDDAERRDAVFAWLAARLGIGVDDREEDMIAAEFADVRFDTAKCADAARVLAGGKRTDREISGRLGRLARATTPQARYLAHVEATLTKRDREIRTSLMTRALQREHPGLAAWLDGELERARRLQPLIAGAATLAATRSLLMFADAVIGAYRLLKAQRGLLDYDDLIARGRGLLMRSDDAAWVLYKLDGGIDHILVDEAQDTSPAQWQIVRHLAEDMLSGESARAAVPRATFAVGDEKQSIFSFQGADPRMFARMRDFFEVRAAAAGRPWRRVPLERSYRSAPEILAAVDLVFAAPNIADGLSDDGTPPRHEAHRQVPGRVDVWPTAVPDAHDRPEPWTAPVDYAGAADPKVKLARTIAGEIAGWLSSGLLLEAEGRAVRPGDIMILVRRRNEFVDAVVRELKERNVPVAGVDRMRLTGQIVIQDLIALARFALLPEDDLSLAALLKSPMIGLDEDELFTVAHDREASLWQAVQRHAQDGGRFEAARARLARWLSMADRMAPFAFFSRVLAEDGMRRRIAARLGTESDDPVAEFLNAALAFERDHLPSLEGFLAWLVRSEGEIKRDMDHGRDEVRVMTVHGAKGLEANIVILPDTCQTPDGGRGVRLLGLALPLAGNGSPIRLPVWPRLNAAKIIGALGEARDDSALNERGEYLRLLYVAMTRARNWLIVTGYETRQGRAEGCWYDLIRAGLAHRLDAEAGPDGATRWRFRYRRAPDARPDGDGASAGPPTEAQKVPDWALRPPARLATRPQRVAPSRAGAVAGAIFSPLGEDRARRFSRGLAMHSLLEYLAGEPRAEWPDRAARFLDRTSPELTQEARAAIAGEALAVLGSPGFAPFLSQGARSEVAFAATLTGPGGIPVPVDGRIDRLAVLDGVVHVVDFKTHRFAPARVADVPDAQLAQMALYRAALSQIFRGLPVRAALLWTDNASLMWLPDAVLDEALHAALTPPPAPPA